MQTLTLGQAIRLIREHATETQTAFGMALGITQVHVSNLERDKSRPSPGLIAAIREHYGYCPVLLVALAMTEAGGAKGLASITAHRAMLGRSVS